MADWTDALIDEQYRRVDTERVARLRKWLKPGQFHPDEYTANDWQKGWLAARAQVQAILDGGCDV